MNNSKFDLTILIYTGSNAVENLLALLPQIQQSVTALSIDFETIILADPIHENTRKVIEQNRAIFLQPSVKGYGAAFTAGLEQAKGAYVIVIDADHSQPAAILNDLWNARDTADVIIASRYIPNGSANMPFMRRVLSRALNAVFSRGMDLNVKDMSSGFRLYKSHIIKKIKTENTNYDVLQEILVKMLMEGYLIREIPFKYESHIQDNVFDRLINFGLAYLKTYRRLWKLRNSIASADYDARAYNALMPPQRYWQRQRYKHVTKLLHEKGKCLDVGCGSSRIIGALPPGSIALDILLRKLRYARRFKQITVQGSIFELPVTDESFPCVLCSQVIEHVPRANVLDELDRVLQPGGFLILGTPDYAKWQWVVIEWLYKILLPQAYADEHITHYTYRELTEEFVSRRGYKLEAVKYILQGELILGLRKPIR
jgi:dolichol-phosphate mannosyltransferase